MLSQKKLLLQQSVECCCRHTSNRSVIGSPEQPREKKAEIHQTRQGVLVRGIEQSRSQRKHLSRENDPED